MTEEQKELLEREYERNPTNWSTADINRLADRLGLNRTKVYKWHWDHRKRQTAEAQSQQQQP